MHPAESLSRTEREQLARALLERDRRRREHPLAYATCWDRPLPRTSQRRAILDLAPTTIILGGNRTGKSAAGAMLTVAHALGSSHPDAARWCSLNGVDPASIPSSPGRACASALTSADSVRYQRAKLDLYLPAGTTWRNREGQGEALARLPGGGSVACKSNDQGSRSYQGDSWRFLWLDEEHDVEVYREGTMRLLDQRGTCLLTMTPLLGLTWVYDLVQVGRADVSARWLHMLDNPYLPIEEATRLLASYGPGERAARERGEFAALEGRVYPAWRREVHIVQAFDPPADWPRYGAFDFGTRNPAAWGYYAHDPADDVLHLCRLHYRAELTLSEHVTAWRALLDGQPPCEWIVADPEDRGARLALATEHDIQTIAATKDVRPGINAVAERLAPDAEGRPHLVIHDHPSTRPFVREIEGYHWQAPAGSRDGPDAPTKRDDHALDGCRYLCLRLLRGEIRAL